MIGLSWLSELHVSLSPSATSNARLRAKANPQSIRKRLRVTCCRRPPGRALCSERGRAYLICIQRPTRQHAAPKCTCFGCTLMRLPCWSRKTVVPINDDQASLTAILEISDGSRTHPEPSHKHLGPNGLVVWVFRARS